jgi:putative transcriptional regulator
MIKYTPVLTYCKSFFAVGDYFFHQKIMIRCHFARLLGERKLKISDVARDTGINRGTLTRMYYETAERIELEVLDQLCEYFSIELHELIVREKPPET